ncbi:MAG: 2-amino-4-hydroxy-6-hydroxymethyldihydropteridine diphosphokinase [Pseudooceanicola sp.]
MNGRFLAAIGGNLPFDDTQPKDVLLAALDRIARLPLRLTAVSAIYRTPAFPAGSGPDFANAAFAFDSDLSPARMLEQLHAVEAFFGRERQQRWSGRTLDLDLLACGDVVLPDRGTWQAWHDLPLALQASESPKELILPHPRLQDRAFVLVPLSDVAPRWRHPALDRTVAEMCADLPETEVDSVVRWADPPCV